MKMPGQRLEVVRIEIGGLPGAVQQQKRAPVLQPSLEIVHLGAHALGARLLFAHLHFCLKADVGVFPHAPVVGKPGLRLDVHGSNLPLG